MSRLKLGYVGCGFMAQKVHLPNILALSEECELVALAEVRTQLGEKVQSRLDIPRLYQNHLQLAENREIEAVAVSGHFANQGEIAIDLLLSGKHVFVEKPMAIGVEQAKRILEAERNSGKRLMVGYMKRYDAGYILAKQMVEERDATGDFGQLRYVRNHGIVAEWIGGLDTPMDITEEPYPQAECPWPDWMPAEDERGYLSYLQQYTHNVNFLRWILNAEDDIEVVSTVLDPHDGISGVTVLRVAGVTAVIESGSVRGHRWNEHTQLFYDGGWILTESPVLLQRNTCATVEMYRGNTPNKSTSQTFPENGFTWAYKEEMRHFVQSVKADMPFNSPASDAYHDVRILEEIYKKHVESR